MRFEDESHASVRAAKARDQGSISTVTPQSAFLDKSRFPIGMKAKLHHLQQDVETELRSCDGNVSPPVLDHEHQVCAHMLETVPYPHVRLISSLDAP